MSGSHQQDNYRGPPMAMISFPVEVDGDRSFENMHGRYVSINKYEIDNSPFYAYGISQGDVVSVVERDGRLVFDTIDKRGGHSTYRVKLPRGKNHEYFLKHWPKIEAYGCSYEGSSASDRRLYSIDLPPSVNVGAVYGILDEYEKLGVWEFEEAHYCDQRH